MTPPLNRFSQFWTELKRRKVFRVLAMYTATAFIFLEAVDIIAPSMGLPDWTLRFVIILIIIGFPISALVSWIFDITPEGLLKTAPLNENAKKDIQPQPSRRLLSVNNIVIAMLIAVVLILIYPKVFKTDKASIGEAVKKNGVIAILPFMNNTGDDSYDHWEYGISELLISSLSTSNELTVIDNQTITDIIQNAVNVQTASLGPDIAKEVARKTQVKSYINGTYLLAGSTFRINLKLIETKTNEVLKTISVEGRKDSIFSLVDDLSDAIIDYLEISIMEEGTNIETSDYLTTSSPEAYKYFIQGMEAYWRGNNRGAMTHLNKAIEIDSTFTSAYFYLSLSWSLGGYYVGVKRSMLKAYEGKDMLSGKMLLWLEAFKSQYIDKNPYESINYFKQVSEIDPLSRLNWFWLGNAFIRVEDYDDALRSFEQILALNKQLGPWKNLYFYTNLGRVYQKIKKYNNAQKIYIEGLQLFHESAYIHYSQALCALRQNDTSSANHYINQYKSVRTREGINLVPILTAYIGNIYNQAGQIQKAEELYRIALKMRLNQGGPVIDPVHYGNSLFWFYEVLGNLLIDNNINVEEGMEYIQIALDLSKEITLFGDHPNMLAGLGNGYYKLGRFKEAAQVLKQAEEGMTVYDHPLHQLIQKVEQTLADQNKIN